MAAVHFLQTSVLYCDDNLPRLAQFPADSVDLIYLDPPFFSNRNYEVIWGDEAEVRSFEDRWEGGIQVYVAWMRERVMEMRRILKPTGSLYLHCDWHASHYLKQMLDDVFGDNRFQNEIVWWYRGGGVSPSRWGRRHDTIFFYTKGPTWTFNVDPVRTAYSQESKDRLQYKAKSFRGNKVYDGYEQNPLGKHPDDVWELQPIMPSAKERLGYPTQKPEKLLQRVIEASSNVGNVVLDPFAGCGTALVVAERLKRKWIGIDISPTAVELMKRRMEKIGATGITLVGMPVSEEQLHELKPFEFQNWVIQRMNGTHSPKKSGDMGIDGFSFFEHLPIQVKQSSSVGREVVDKFETAIGRSGKKKGYIVAFSFTSGAHEEAARSAAKNKIEVELVTVADLLEDKAKLVTPVSEGLFGETLPLPEPRPTDSRPSVEELVKSETGAGLPQVAVIKKVIKRPSKPGRKKLKR
ncbi:MAG TPA: DNA methyltransferase [Vicinamibacterales bacterium]|nr:DNA methyltransferase [Vicinamibacterales bacterium]